MMCNILFIAHYYLFVMSSFLFIEYNYLFVFLKYLFLVAEINYLVLKINRCKSCTSYNPAYVSNNWCTRYFGLLSTLLHYFLCTLANILCNMLAYYPHCYTSWSGALWIVTVIASMIPRRNNANRYSSPQRLDLVPQ